MNLTAVLDKRTVLKLISYLNRESVIERDHKPGLRRDEALERVRLECWYTREIGLLEAELRDAQGAEEIDELGGELCRVMDDRIHARAMLRMRFLRLWDDSVTANYNLSFGKARKILDREACIRELEHLIKKLDESTDFDEIADLSRRIAKLEIEVTAKKPAG